MIEGEQGLITFFGRERIEELYEDNIYPIAVYAVDENYHLSVANVTQIERIESKREILKIETKGRRGGLFVGEKIEVVVKREGNYLWEFSENLEKGDNLLGFVESIVSYDLGRKATSDFLIENIEYKEVERTFNVSIEEEYNLIINNLIINCN